MSEYKFRVQFLEEAKSFLDELDEKSRDKVIYNIWKARGSNDKELFKKLQDEFGNLERYSIKRIIAFLHFGIKQKVQIRLWSQPTD